MGSGKHGSQVEHDVGIECSAEAHGAFSLRCVKAFRLVCHVAHHLLLHAAVRLFPLLLCQIEDLSFPHVPLDFGR